MRVMSREGEREGQDDGLARLGLLASAIAGRAVHVAPAAPGEPPWTDGQVIFVRADASPPEQVESLAVQASLLAAGSLDPGVLRRLVGRPKRTRRYLAIEGHRALAEVEALLPRRVRRLVDGGVAAGIASPGESLAAAFGRAAVSDPPDAFGVIRTRPLLASLGRAGSSTTAGPDGAGQRRNRLLAELPEDADDDGTALDFSSDAGGGGPLGRLLGRLLEVARRLGGGGPPGANEPTHWMRTGARPGSRTALSTAQAGMIDQPAAQTRRGTKYPEWDVHRRRYRPDWCTVHEVAPRTEGDEPAVTPDAHGLRRPLAHLATGLELSHRQAQGDDIDIDAAIEARVETIAGSAPDEAVYLDSLRRRRDLSVLVLLDISGSVAEPGAAAPTVHEQQRAAAAALAVALHEIGDRVALYAFRSRGRSAVDLVPVKTFDDRLDTVVLQRLHGLEPGAYSRLGAAIRHGAAILEQRAGTLRRLLVVLSDGLAYDHGYEPVYGAADARRALAEARQQGVGCLCLGIGASTDAEALRRVFGSAAHATIPRNESLGRVVGPLFRSAIRSAEIRRPGSSRACR